jgi:hypothetical protein
MLECACSGRRHRRTQDPCSANSSLPGRPQPPRAQHPEQKVSTQARGARPSHRATPHLPLPLLRSSGFFGGPPALVLGRQRQQAGLGTLLSKRVRAPRPLLLLLLSPAGGGGAARVEAAHIRGSTEQPVPHHPAHPGCPPRPAPPRPAPPRPAPPRPAPPHPLHTHTSCANTHAGACAGSSHAAALKLTSLRPPPLRASRPPGKGRPHKTHKHAHRPDRTPVAHAGPAHTALSITRRAPTGAAHARACALPGVACAAGHQGDGRWGAGGGRGLPSVP